jgi:hypothetical protein
MMTSLTRFTGLRFILVAICPFVFAMLAETVLANDATVQEQDIKAVKEFLAKYPSTWEKGPLRLTNKAIETAYPNVRFYYVFSSAESKKTGKSKDNLVAGVNEQGEVGFPAFPTQMKIGGVENVKVVAAALMSLHLMPTGPVSIEPNDVSASQKADGWFCRANKNGCFFKVTLFNYHDGRYDFITSGGPNEGYTVTLAAILCFLLLILVIVGFWKVFVKAGKPGWGAIIPIYNVILLLEIAGRPVWWILLLLVPFVDVVVGVIIGIDIAKNFGKGAIFGLGLAFMGFIFFPILGFSDARYQPVGR